MFYRHLGAMSNPQHHLAHHDKVAKIEEQTKEPSAHAREFGAHADE